MTPGARSQLNWRDFAAALLLIALAATSSLRQEDIRFWDESSYLERGLTLGFGSQPGWEWNPLYTDTYWILSRFFPNPIDLYFAGRITAATILTLAVWLSLRLFTRPLLALAGGIVMAALPITYVWPGVSNPSAALIVLAIAVVWRWRTTGGLVAGSALTWLAAATRPEFVWVASMVLIIVGITTVLRARARASQPRVVALSLLGLLATPVLLIAGYGNPTDFESRSWLAFEQHYELRFATAVDDPWQISEDVVGRDFPGATSIASAAIANPTAITVHIARNGLILPLSAGGHFMGLGGDSRQQNQVGIIAASVWMVGFTLTLINAAKNRSDTLHRLRNFFYGPSARVPLLVATVLLGSVLLSTLIIYPRPHYLGVLIATALLMTGVAIDRFGRNSWTKLFPERAVLIVGMGILLFNISFLVTENTMNKSNLTALRLMNSSQTEWRLLTPERPISIYLNEADHILDVDEEYGSFAELIDALDVNVVFDGVLFRRASWSTLEDFERFLDSPQDFGFTPITPGNSFLVRP